MLHRPAFRPQQGNSKQQTALITDRRPSCPSLPLSELNCRWITRPANDRPHHPEGGPPCSGDPTTNLDDPGDTVAGRAESDGFALDQVLSEAAASRAAGALNVGFDASDHLGLSASRNWPAGGIHYAPNMPQ